MIELDNLQALKRLFVANGWTWRQSHHAVLFESFSLRHDFVDHQKETQSTKWTLMAFAVTTAGHYPLFHCGPGAPAGAGLGIVF